MLYNYVVVTKAFDGNTAMGNNTANIKIMGGKPNTLWDW